MLPISDGRTVTWFVFVISSALCRRYDIEEESRKLYHEDLKTVLTRFRRSPDYLKILESKAEDMEQELSDISLQVLFYHTEALPKDVINRLGLNKTTATTRREDDKPDQVNFRAKKARHHRRSGRTDEKDGVQKLDSYDKLNSPLSLKQRNMMRDLGFEYAGKVIHKLIESFSDGSEEPVSTQQPGGGEDVPTTTEHVTEHIVTEETTAASEDAVRQNPAISRSVFSRSPLSRPSPRAVSHPYKNSSGPEHEVMRHLNKYWSINQDTTTSTNLRVYNVSAESDLKDVVRSRRVSSVNKLYNGASLTKGNQNIYPIIPPSE